MSTEATLSAPPATRETQLAAVSRLVRPRISALNDADLQRMQRLALGLPAQRKDQQQQSPAEQAQAGDAARALMALLVELINSICKLLGLKSRLTLAEIRGEIAAECHHEAMTRARRPMRSPAEIEADLQAVEQQKATAETALLQARAEVAEQQAQRGPAGILELLGVGRKHQAAMRELEYLLAFEQQLLRAAGRELELHRERWDLEALMSPQPPRER